MCLLWPVSFDNSKALERLGLVVRGEPMPKKYSNLLEFLHRELDRTSTDAHQDSQEEGKGRQVVSVRPGRLKLEGAVSECRDHSQCCFGRQLKRRALAEVEGWLT